MGGRRGLMNSTAGGVGHCSAGMYPAKIPLVHPVLHPVLPPPPPPPFFLFCPRFPSSPPLPFSPFPALFPRIPILSPPIPPPVFPRFSPFPLPFPPFSPFFPVSPAFFPVFPVLPLVYDAPGGKLDLGTPRPWHYPYQINSAVFSMAGGSRQVKKGGKAERGREMGQRGEMGKGGGSTKTLPIARPPPPRLPVVSPPQRPPGSGGKNLGSPGAAISDSCTPQCPPGFPHHHLNPKFPPRPRLHGVACVIAGGLEG